MPVSIKSKLYSLQLLMVHNYVHAAKVSDELKPTNKRDRGKFVLSRNKILVLLIHDQQMYL